MMHEAPVYLHGYFFEDKVGEVMAVRSEEVVPALQLVEEKVAAGLHAAGFVSYDSAGVINADLATAPGGSLPLLWFGLFRKRSAGPFPQVDEPFHATGWQASWNLEEFSLAVATIRDYIASGDCYQVNLTMREEFSFSGSPCAFFNAICRRQPTPYSSYLEVGKFRILSASPELFFSLSNGILTTRPMKGTAARGATLEEDETRKNTLKESPKELAENVMIVDLLRNDMGIVSETGSVHAASLFDVETHPTLHQMTSTLRSRLRPGTGIVEVMQALFPCGSITGAPKRRCMEIVAEVEDHPRGLYTGCIGYLSPGGEASFSVAIRTALIDVESGRGEIGIGSGITYDSVAEAEYLETMSKAQFAREEACSFHLIESLLYDGSYFLLERHLERLARSAARFGFPFDRTEAEAALGAVAAKLTGKQKVRLLLYQGGAICCEAAPVTQAGEDVPIGFAEASVDSSDPFLYHKTSRRRVFTEELAKRPDVAEVLFINERGEVTEGAYSNIVAVCGGEAYTPPASSGLLPGVMREELLSKGLLKERVLTPRDLAQAEELYLINSVRKWRKAHLIPSPPGRGTG